MFGSLGSEMFYIFGGFGPADDVSTLGHLNDLWKYDIKSGLWCFLKGSTSIDSFSNLSGGDEEFYFVFDDGHLPGARSNHVTFTTMFSMFVFGGETSSGYDIVYDEDKNATNEMWELRVTPKPEMWRMLVVDQEESEVIPSRRFAACGSKRYTTTSSTDDPVFIFGGLQKSRKVKNDLWNYWIMENRFEKLRNGKEVGIDTGWNMTEYYYETTAPFEKNGSVDYNPPERFDCICWVSSDGDFYVFGGTLRNLMSLNDIWMWNYTEGIWVWTNDLGISNLGNTGNQVVVNQYDPSNIPAGRSEGIYFENQKDMFNEIFFFGGLNRQSENTFSDVWAFSHSLNQFKFLNGSSAVPNVPNTEKSITQIGSRYSSVAVGFFSDNSFLLYGGEG